MNKLDQAINEIAHEIIPEDRLEQASARVRARLFAQAPAASERIRGCSDYQTLIPAYLNRTLSAGRSLLLQDHTRECPACRQALGQARGSNGRTLARPVTPPSHSIPKWWAIAAMAVVTLGAGWLIVDQLLFPGNGRLSVASVRGVLYTVTDTAVTPVFAGHEIPEGRRIRTAKDSTAMVRLADGSLVELNDRAELSVTRSGHGAAIHLDRGSIIVQAAKQRTGTLDVLTADCTVSVKGTIFAVDRGVKGSRVSVVEGSVAVAQGSKAVLLKPGQQATTDSSVARTPVQDAVAWSRDSARYLALLGEFSIIKKGLDAMPSPSLRYSSTLLPLVPSDAVLYAAFPNFGPTLAEADRLFKQRIQASPVLKTWWEEQNSGAKLDEMVQKLRAVSDYLGAEIAVFVTGDWDGNYSAPVILAEVKKDGLEAHLDAEFRAANVQKGPMRFTVRGNVLAVAWDQGQLDNVAKRLAKPRAVADRGLLATAQHAYDSGAGYLLCVNMEQITRDTKVKPQNGAAKAFTGIDGMAYLSVERRDVAGKTENQATLTFQGHRSGISGWLAEPAPMGSLDFVSPNAAFVTSMVLRSPQWMIGDVLRYLAEQDPNFEQSLERVRQETGIQISPELGQPLGGEFTFAVDGPLLPLPSWKFAIEVYSPDRLQLGIEQVIEAVNKNSKCPDCRLTLAKEQANGRTYYTLTSAKVSYEIDYTYVDGYLVAAPSRTLLNSAIQNRATGYTLARSENFRSQLPVGGNLNFSALVYHNVGTTLKPFAEQLGALAGAAEQKASIQALVDNSGPGLIYAIGQDDRITVASAGSFFGLDLSAAALPAVLGRALKH
ncbi:MAG: FecR domain-containing protein [Acidobacteria bacterium]|nr:FecR domain-containing protein [Acidobacteriota bacterium]